MPKDYSDDLFTRLLRKYPNEWVAIFGDTVVAHAAEYECVVRQLAEKGISPETAHYVFVNAAIPHP